ncbi:hypothetical protein AGR13a_Cc330141 [Agrobacterium genomosp. 13 str. CFBP 6927]|uniref:Uncharacterized protein n=1 Tax=Agrobacterium genomosp. 13 str. CFBP 6927 TaxID=1183428 RepID=A0ABP2BKS9_9HYPH|nr:hypothetical protein AGR13a_Cc330141 [Agrobacterium genomosp. 13 str. CFBP 6927]
MKRPDGKKIQPSEQVLASDDGRDIDQLVLPFVFKVDDDPEIEMTVIEAQHRSLGRGGQDGKPAR